MAKKAVKPRATAGAKVREALEFAALEPAESAASAASEPAPRRRSSPKAVKESNPAAESKPLLGEPKPFSEPEPRPAPVVIFQPVAEAPKKPTPFEIGQHPAVEDVPAMAREMRFFGPSHVDRAVFCRQLAMLIEVGIPLLPALQMLARRTSHPKLARAIAAAARRVEEGQPLSAGMEENREVFSPLVCNIIKVGEMGGILESSLVRLAQIMEMKAEMRRKIASAMMYPIVALGIAFFVIVLIMAKAVPVFTTVYKDAGQDLPGITKFVIAVSSFTVNYFILWFVLLVLAIAGIVYALRRPEGKRFVSYVSIKVPALSRITKKIAVARFSRTLGGLLQAGIPLVEAMAIAADTNENLIIGEALRKAHDSVARGQKIARPLAESNVFPPMVVDMIGIGEETGTLDRMLEKIADIYDADVDATLRGLATIIEPLLIVFLGGIVIFIALAVMLPYFNLVTLV